MRPKFKHQGELMRAARIYQRPLSQQEVADSLNLKSGQYISNIERGLQGVPPADIMKFAKAVSLDPQALANAMAKDYKEHLDSIMTESKGKLAAITFAANFPTVGHPV